MLKAGMNRVKVNPSVTNPNLNVIRLSNENKMQMQLIEELSMKRDGIIESAHQRKKDFLLRKTIEENYVLDQIQSRNLVTFFEIKTENVKLRNSVTSLFGSDVTEFTSDLYEKLITRILSFSALLGMNFFLYDATKGVSILALTMTGRVVFPFAVKKLKSEELVLVRMFVDDSVLNATIPGNGLTLSEQILQHGKKLLTAKKYVLMHSTKTLNCFTKNLTVESLSNKEQLNMNTITEKRRITKSHYTEYHDLIKSKEKILATKDYNPKAPIQTENGYERKIAKVRFYNSELPRNIINHKGLTDKSNQHRNGNAFTPNKLIMKQMNYGRDVFAAAIFPHYVQTDEGEVLGGHWILFIELNAHQEPKRFILQLNEFNTVNQFIAPRLICEFEHEIGNLRFTNDIFEDFDLSKIFERGIGVTKILSDSLLYLRCELFAIIKQTRNRSSTKRMRLKSEPAQRIYLQNDTDIVTYHYEFGVIAPMFVETRLFDEILRSKEEMLPMKFRDAMMPKHVSREFQPSNTNEKLIENPYYLLTSGTLQCSPIAETKFNVSYADDCVTMPCGYVVALGYAGVHSHICIKDFFKIEISGDDRGHELFEGEFKCENCFKNYPWRMLAKSCCAHTVDDIRLIDELNLSDNAQSS